jgi:ribosome maturation protein Sdo1
MSEGQTRMTEKEREEVRKEDRLWWANWLFGQGMDPWTKARYRAGLIWAASCMAPERPDIRAEADKIESGEQWN